MPERSGGTPPELPGGNSAERAGGIPPERASGIPPERAGGTPPEPPGGPPRTSRRRAGVLIGVLCLLLGFALAVQVRTTSDASGLGAARQEDLVRILDDLSAREDRLREDITGQERIRDELATGGNQADTALDEARLRQEQLAILAGTVAAEGPGIQLTVSDPAGQVGPEMLLDAIQELRAAGAEAIQVGDVRIGVSSAVIGTPGAPSVDGIQLSAPYRIVAIGDPPTLETALNIPGGVVNTVSRAGGEARIEQRDEVTITALRVIEEPEYAQPAPDTD